MIIYKDWITSKNGKTYVAEGYFLFGFIPLLISYYDMDIPANHQNMME